MVENFDLSGWTMFSDRRNSQSYYSADRKWMVKFNTEVADTSIESFEKEKATAEKALAIGVKTPKVSDVVKLPDGRCGIIYEYIEGKQSIARATSENLDKIDYYMGRFAKSAKEFHKCKCDVKNTTPWEERILRQLDKYPFFTDDQKVQIKELIDKTEKKTTAILGDFHTGNFIITADKEYVIDLVSFSYGNPIYDIANFHWFSWMFPEQISEHIFHCKREHMEKMWISFVKQYMGFTTDAEVEKFTAAIKKYAMISFQGMLDFIDATPDIPILQKIFATEFDKAFANKEILSI